MKADGPIATDHPWLRIQGFHSVKHSTRFGADIHRVVTTNRASAIKMATELAPDLIESMKTAAEISTSQFEQLLGGGHPTGVGALASRPDLPPVAKFLELARGDAPVVLLEDPRHLGNIGAVIRVVAALGGAGVMTTGTVDPWHETALRGSAGLHFALTVGGVSSLESLDATIIAFDPEGVDIRSTRLPHTAILAFGSERNGISSELRQKATAVVRIPMRVGVSSLNLATSVAIGLFHWVGLADSPPSPTPKLV